MGDKIPAGIPKRLRHSLKTFYSKLHFRLLLNELPVSPQPRLKILLRKQKTNKNLVTKLLFHFPHFPKFACPEISCLVRFWGVGLFFPFCAHQTNKQLEVYPIF